MENIGNSLLLDVYLLILLLIFSFIVLSLESRSSKYTLSAIICGCVRWELGTFCSLTFYHEGKVFILPKFTLTNLNEIAFYREHITYNYLQINKYLYFIF